MDHRSRWTTRFSISDRAENRFILPRFSSAISPEAARKDKDTFRGFIAPLLDKNEMVDRSCSSPGTTGRSITVPVIDLGPSKKTHCALDLTVAAAKFFNPTATANNFGMKLDLRIINGVRLAGLTPGVAPVGDFQQRLTASALNEFNFFHEIQETHSPLREQIQRYWEELELPFTSPYLHKSA
jgi:hypothetical protein